MTTHRRPSMIAASATMCAGLAAWLSGGVMAVAGSEVPQRLGLVPPLWALALLLTAALGIAIVVRGSTDVWMPVFLAGLIAVPWLPVPIPTVALILTGPIVLMVWGMIALSMAAVSLLRRPTWLAMVNASNRAPFLSAIAAFVAFLAVWSAQTAVPTGDEPHYLLTAHSLWWDHDARVANNYERRDYQTYYPGFLQPHTAAPDATGAVYSAHPVGLPLVVAPVLALVGYRGVVVFIAALVAFGTGCVWKAGYLLTGDSGAAWFGWAVVTLTAPALLYGSLVYPDSVAGIVLVAGALVLVVAHVCERSSLTPLDKRESSMRWSHWQTIALSTSVAALPWLHPRLALPAITLAGVLCAHIATLRAGQRHMGLFLIPLAVSGLSWLTLPAGLHGMFSSAGSMAERGLLSLRRIPGGLLGLFIDQEFGLLPSAPVHLISFAGFWCMFKQHRRLSVELLLVVVPYVLLVASWDVWWAGTCPPARFLVPIIFVLGLPAAALWAWQGDRGRTVSLTLLAASGLIGAVLAFAGDGVLAYNSRIGRARWLEWASPLVNTPAAFPSFFRSGAIDPGPRAIFADLITPAVVWAVSLVLGWIAFVAVDRRLRAGHNVRALSAPMCLVLACGVAIGAEWSIEAVNPITATRAQLNMLRIGPASFRSLGIEWMPIRIERAATTLSKLAIATSVLEAPPLDTRLFVTDVPAGNYHLRVSRTPTSSGRLSLGIGRATLPAALWSLSSSTEFTFHLPAQAATIVVRGDSEALATSGAMELLPDASPHVTASAGRARDAARYGDRVVYALDDRLWLEKGGFWVMGDRRSNVVVSSDTPLRTLDLLVRNSPINNTIRVRSGKWYNERELVANETWSVTIPLRDTSQDVQIGFDVARGIRPIDFDSSSTDRRVLGCWVQVR